MPNDLDRRKVVILEDDPELIDEIERRLRDLRLPIDSCAADEKHHTVSQGGEAADDDNGRGPA